MFCSECGTKVPEGAKFCFNCGARLVSNSIDRQEQIAKRDTQAINSERVSCKEFESYIRKNIVNSFYDKHADATAEQFYKKAIFYDLKPGDVDILFVNATNLLKKIDLYIANLFEETREILLEEGQIVELEDYCKSLGIENEETEKILRNYIVRNEVEEKRVIFKAILEEYAVSGDKKREVIDEIGNLKSVSTETVYDGYVKVICNAESILDEHGCNADGIIELEVSEDVEEKIKHLGFNDEELQLFYEGYEIYSGIYERREREITERVISALDEKFAVDLTLFGREIHFGPKYFYRDFIMDTYKKILYDFHEEIEQIDKSQNHSMVKAAEVCQSYLGLSLLTYYTEMDLLEVAVDSELIETYGENGEKAINAIEALRKSYDDISERQRLEKEYRQLRKECRGRWQGGGFGVGGAIKGAVTAGAMNAVGGAMHSAFNAVGNITSSMISNKEKRTIGEGVWDIVDIIDDNILELAKSLVQVIIDEYPELWYGRDTIDKKREAELWERFKTESSTGKMDTAVDIIKNNPYSFVNLLQLMAEFSNYPDICEMLENEMEEVDKHFDVVNELHNELESVNQEIKRLAVKKEEYSEDDLKFIRELKNKSNLMFGYLSKMINSHPEMEEKQIKLKNAISEMDEVFAFFDDKIEKEQKMFCPYCGRQILRTVKFCNFCGAEINYKKVHGNANSKLLEKEEVVADAEDRTMLFTTKTCPNCRIVCDMLEEANITYEKIDAKESHELVEQFGITQAPTLVVVKNGRVSIYANASNIIGYINEN